VTAAQIKALSRLETSVTSAHASLRAVIGDVGLDPDRMVPSAGGTAQGGPFIPARLDPRLGAFEASVVRLQPRIVAVEWLRSVVGALPLRRPMGVEAEQTSAFGHRLDPFTRSLAMHSGIDFRAEHGTPVKAGGAGVIVLAEYSGGYGNMPTCRTSLSAKVRRSATEASLAGSDRPAARPARICTMKRGSKAMRLIPCGFCAPASASATPTEWRATGFFPLRSLYSTSPTSPTVVP
jgi:hypothetical protein